MDSNNLNISSIESFFEVLLDKKVTSNLFFTNLPNTIDSSWADLVVVDCANSIQDLDAFGRGSVLIWLYAKPLSSGRKNVAVLNKLEIALNKAIKSNINPNYGVIRVGEFADYDTDAKMHCNIVQLRLIIT